MNELRPAGWPEALATTEPPLIELTGITKAYGTAERPVPVLHGIDLTIEAGEFVALLGASGSGKSTLMNLLGCLDRPTGGTYRFAGDDVSGLEPDELAALRRETFGFVFQGYHLIPSATALENVEMPAIYAGLPGPARAERAQHLLSEFGLADRLDHRPSQLSGGQQQRVAIARALMNGGRVILADEPTGALDSRTGQEVMAQLARLNAEGHTIILITHDREVARHAHRVVEMRDGRILSDTRSTHAREIDPSLAPLSPEPTRSSQGSRLATIGPTLALALRSLAQHRMRTALTLLGIVIGVASVIAMMAVGEGTRREVLDRFTWLGVNNLIVRPGAPNVRWAPSTLTIDDATAIAALPNVSAVLPEMNGQVTLRTAQADYQTSVNGSTDALPVVRNWEVGRGRFLDEADIRDRTSVAVIGETVQRAIFLPGDDPLGRWILVNNIPFQVIGVMTRKGAAPQGWDLDDVVFVPIGTASIRVFGRRYLSNILVLIDDPERRSETERLIRDTIIERHRIEDFAVRNMADAIESAAATAEEFTLLMASIAAISLLVGGIGVMNIMLVSVMERRREIGIRMAAGARPRDISSQFLTEAALVSGLGGLVGVALGIGIALLLPAFGQASVLTLLPVVGAAASAVLTGLLFGVAPARKASRLDPVAALASE